MDIQNITPTFNARAAEYLPQTEFAQYLTETFGRQTAMEVIGSFEQMNLPAPKTGDEFYPGTEGGLVLLNRYGVVLRIEHTVPVNGAQKADRIDDSPWIPNPLAAVKAGNAIIEVCAGAPIEENEKNVDFVAEQLLKQKINYWDQGLSNNARLPVATPNFPEGVPVVIDRLAAQRLTDDVRSVEKLKSPQEDARSELLAREAAKAQAELYAPAREAFAAAWPDKDKMKEFWSLCAQNVQDGKFVAGWNTQDKKHAEHKTMHVRFMGMSYEKALAAADKPDQPRAPAVSVAVKR